MGLVRSTAYHGHRISKWSHRAGKLQTAPRIIAAIYDMFFSWFDTEEMDYLNRERALESEVTRLGGLFTDYLRAWLMQGHFHLAAELEKKIRFEEPANYLGYMIGVGSGDRFQV